MKISSLLKERWPFILIVAIFWLFMIYVNDPFDSEKGTSAELSYGSTEKIVGEITSDLTLEQDIEIDGTFKKFALCMATYARTNQGSLYVSVIDQNGDDIYKKTLELSEIGDNQWEEFIFDSPMRGGKYTVRIKSDAISGSAVTVYYGDDSGIAKARINGKEIAGSLNIKVEINNPVIQTTKIAAWLIAIVVSLMVTLVIKEANERSFLLLACTFGLLMVFYNPFAHVIDESTHFFHSYMIADGNVLDDVNEEGQIGGEVASNFAQMFQLSLKSYSANPDHWNQHFSEDTDFYPCLYASSTLPFDHAIAAIGIFAGKLFRLPAVLVIVLGRMADLTFYVIFAYLAIKKARYYKNIFFAVALLPASIWLAGSYSYDPILIGASLLFTSICINYYMGEEDQKVSAKDSILLLLSAIFIISVKYMIYMPILLLFFLIPRKKFSGKQYKIVLALAILIILTIVFAQVKLLGRYQIVEDRNGDVDTARQVRYMLGHINATIRTFANYVLNNTLYLFEGTNYLPTSSTIISCINLFIVSSALLENKTYQFECSKKKIRFNLLCIVIFLICYALIIAALYVGFTPVGTASVLGIQPRYLYPVLPVLMVALSGINIKNHINHYEQKIAFIMEIGLVNMTVDVLLGVFA